MRRGVGTWCCGAALTLCVGGGDAASASSWNAVHLVPAADPVLASMLLTARGTKEPVLLFDPRDRSALERFRAGWRGTVNCYRRADSPATITTLMQDAATEPCTVVDDLVSFAQMLWPDASVAVAVSASDYGWLLRAAAFAGASGSALLPLEERAMPPPGTLSAWHLGTLYLTPSAAQWAEPARAVVPRVVKLADADALTRELIRVLEKRPSVVVVADPSDREGFFSPSSLSLLAPLVSALHRAPLVLARHAEPERIERHVLAFVDRHELSPSHVVLVGDEIAVPSHRIPDPVLAAGGPEARGGGTVIRVELFSQIHRERPQDLVVGRIVAEGASQGSVVLARQYHRPQSGPAKPVVFLSNADHVFRLGETISRSTAAELRNVGVPVRAYYGEEITQSLIQQSLTVTDMLVWEGHVRDLTLEEQGGIAVSGAPEVVVLQGCYTFDRSDPFILMDKGTVAILGTSTAVYSAPGSGLARAFFDAILYDGVDLGTATRNARNYLLALAQLQRAREHADWRKTYRAALAFALWGDPTFRPPLKPRQPRISPVDWRMGQDGLTLTLPGGKLQEISVGPYRAELPPRAMLGGLLLRGDGEKQDLKELYYAVNNGGDTPKTVCRPTKGWNVISLYAPRTKALTVLARADWKILGPPSPGQSFAFPLVDDPSGCPDLTEPTA